MFDETDGIRKRSKLINKESEFEDNTDCIVEDLKYQSWTKSIFVVKVSFILVCLFSYIIGSFIGLKSLDIAEQLRGYPWNYEKNCVINTRGSGEPKCWHVNICEYCMAVKGPVIVNASDLTKEQFQRYDVEKQPLLVKGLFNNGDDFNLDWLRNNYLSDIDLLLQQKNKSSSCSYFINFFTEDIIFEDLEVMLRLPANDSKFQNPWYTGWRVCQEKMIEKLSKLIKRPHFFQDDSCIYGVPYIYIGTPGIGVNESHIDPHRSSSYQLQMSGLKRWMLEAPKECSSPLLCGSNIMEIEVEQGDALFVDTSYWYHSTKVLGDSLSYAVIFDYNYWLKDPLCN